MLRAGGAETRGWPGPGSGGQGWGRGVVSVGLREALGALLAVRCGTPSPEPEGCVLVVLPFKNVNVCTCSLRNAVRGDAELSP